MIRNLQLLHSICAYVLNLLLEVLHLLEGLDLFDELVQVFAFFIVIFGFHFVTDQLVQDVDLECLFFLVRDLWDFYDVLVFLVHRKLFGLEIRIEIIL